MNNTLSKQPLNKYTESQWNREIGWGKCPDEYLWILEESLLDESGDNDDDWWMFRNIGLTE